MEIRWRLRMAAAQREVWTGAQLRRLLAEQAGVQLSSASISALLTKQPSQVKLETLAGLCTALQCQPNDLIQVDTAPVAKAQPKRDKPPATRRAAGGRGRTPPPFDRHLLGLRRGRHPRQRQVHTVLLAGSP